MGEQQREITKMDLVLDGCVEGNPLPVSEFNRVRIMRVKICTIRKSGTRDYFWVHYPTTLRVVLKDGDYIHVTGDIRTCNKAGSKDVVGSYVYAKSIEILEEEPEVYSNRVTMSGVVLVGDIEVRKSYTEDNVDVAVYRVQAYRGFDRYSYFRVTTFGKEAIFLGNIKDSVTELDITCRLQSFRRSSDSDDYMCLTAYKVLAVGLDD